MPKLKLEVSDERMDRFNISLPEKLIAALNDYHEFYEREVLGKSIPKNYFFQRVLQTALEDDKDFQKYLKTRQTAAPATGTPAAANADVPSGAGKRAEQVAAGASKPEPDAPRDAGSAGAGSESSLS